ncbi:MAG: hypothetical protein IJ105_04650 [Bacilli bacterium]|nr:hypothetical protein [Bacilli bacterium]
MNDMYFIKKNIDRLYDGLYTNFLDIKYQNLIKSKLKINYNIFKPFDESEKVIFYTKTRPEISLFEIKSYEKLRHQEIMGSIYSLGIDESLFGEIIIDNNRYFIYIFSNIENDFINRFNMVSNKHISLEKIDIDYLKEYKRKYEEITFVSSSERIDTIVSRITNINRKDILNKIKNNEIIVNYEIVKSNSYILKENDIFSIRKYGKYKYIGIQKNTKKDNYVIKIYKYIN